MDGQKAIIPSCFKILMAYESNLISSLARAISVTPEGLDHRAMDRQVTTLVGALTHKHPSDTVYKNIKTLSL